MQLFRGIVNGTPKIWFPLAIVLLNSVINVLARQHLLTYLDLDLFTISPNIQVIGGFFAIAEALIDWILISVLLFFGCRLLYKDKGERVFRNFFKSIGLCHLVLLVATLSQFILISISLPPDPTTPELTTLPRDLTTLEYNNTTGSQEQSEAPPEALASLELPVQVIDIVGHICFVLILVPVVQTFFQIRWVQALCNVYISYAIYWILSEALWSIFTHILFFFFKQFFDFPSWQPWQPGDRISP